MPCCCCCCCCCSIASAALLRSPVPRTSGSSRGASAWFGQQPPACGGDGCAGAAPFFASLVKREIKMNFFGVGEGKKERMATRWFGTERSIRPFLAMWKTPCGKRQTKFWLVMHWVMSHTKNTTHANHGTCRQRRGLPPPHHPTTPPFAQPAPRLVSGRQGGGFLLFLEGRYIIGVTLS